MIEKPELDENLLIHFGVKGMKWGKRKIRPDEAERKKIFGGARARKIAIGAAVVGGALAVTYLLSKSGRTKVGEAAVSNFVLNRQRQAQQGKSPFGAMAKQFRETRVSRIPSPEEMMADARMAGVRDRVFKEGSQQMTDKSWRDAANFQQRVREAGPPLQLPSIEELRNRLTNPSRG